MSISRVLKWLTGIFEAFLGIPLLGGLFIISNGYTPLLFMLALHIITLLLTQKDEGATIGSFFGIITSIVGIVPILGMIMHMVTALLLFITGSMRDRKTKVTIIE